ncbi:MAG: hypothetical protein GY938_00010, partial [Ketobacter sp.]|nr:hypothetical protein [Ketobacter sp.]
PPPPAHPLSSSHRQGFSACGAVYTDGACSENQKEEEFRCAGIGVWFDDGDSRNLSEPLPSHVARHGTSNNRAELFAAIRAIEIAPHNTPLEIRTDSQWLIKGATGANQRHKNLDLWDVLSRALADRPAHVKFSHVKAHAGHHGNEEANRFATGAVARARALQEPPTSPYTHYTPLTAALRQTANPRHPLPLLPYCSGPSSTPGRDLPTNPIPTTVNACTATITPDTTKAPATPMASIAHPPTHPAPHILGATAHSGASPPFSPPHCL